MFVEQSYMGGFYNSLHPKFGSFYSSIPFTLNPDKTVVVVLLYSPTSHVPTSREVVERWSQRS